MSQPAQVDVSEDANMALQDVFQQECGGDLSLFDRMVSAFCEEQEAAKGDTGASETITETCFRALCEERLEIIRQKDLIDAQGGGGGEQEDDKDGEEDNDETQTNTAKMKQKMKLGFGKLKKRVTKAINKHSEEQRKAKNAESQRVIKALSHRTMGLLKVVVREGLSFPRGGKCTPYMKLTMATEPDPMSVVMPHNVYTTATATGSEPIWEDDSCHLCYNNTADALVLDVWDYSRLGKDTFIGRVVVPVHVIVANTNEAEAVAGCDVYDLERWFPLTDRDGIARGSGTVFLSLRIDRSCVTAPASGMQVPKVVLPEDEAGTQQELSVWAGSWNVANSAPPEDLAPWIPVGVHDIYVVGAQECKYPPRGDTTSCRDDWIGTLIGHFGSNYTLIKYHSLWEIRLSVFVLNEHAHRITGVMFATEATGIGNVMGNKGGVITALSFNHTQLCFVNSHLAAHQDKCQARHNNFRDIVRKAQIGRHVAPGGQRLDLVNQFEHCIWVGDLNYRLDYSEQAKTFAKTPSRRQFDEMTRHLHSGGLSARQMLRTHDQLVHAQLEGVVFHGWDEGDFSNFMPTFKVEVGKSFESYMPKRSPAWCDRVLWRSLPGYASNMEQTSYDSCPALNTSDHKPVAATFRLMCHTVQPGIARGIPTSRRCTLRISCLVAHGFSDCVSRRLAAADVGEVEGEQSGNSMLARAKRKVEGDVNVFLKIFAPFLDAPLVTPACYDTVNPSWQSQLQTELKFNNPARLHHCVLSVQLVEGCSGKRLQGNTTLGYGRIPLNSVNLNSPAGEHGSEAKSQFACDFLHEGIPAGSIRGLLALRWN